MTPRDDGIPVTVLSGPLGAGKTTLLNHLLTEGGDREIAVLVNDMGEVNVDADLLTTGTDLGAEGGVAELSNGCICCELQDDLETEVARLASEREFEHLVVESSGISEPRPVARLFTTDSRAAAAYDLDTLVTVVDAARFHETFGDREEIARETAPGDDDRPLSDLVIEQIEYANVLLLNKCDLVEDADLDRAEELLRALNPDARIYRTVHGEIDPGKIVGTGLFDPATTGTGGPQGALAGPTAEHDHGHDEGADHHAHPDEVYGVDSFVYRRRRPLDPACLRAVLGDLPRSVVRSKGLVWTAGRDDRALLYSQAGPAASVEVVGPWIASLPEIEREMYRTEDLPWDDEHGDRRTELVFIGQGIEEAPLVERLDECLVEVGDDPGETDPFPTEEGERVQFDAYGEDQVP